MRTLCRAVFAGGDVLLPRGLRRRAVAPELLWQSPMIEQLFSSANYQASKQLLDVAARRHEALATNLANVETPGYKRVDFPKNFAHELSARIRAGQARHVEIPEMVEDTTTSSIRKDGNNVDVDKEMMALSKNAAEFDVLAEMVSGSIKQLRLAITGRTL
jgi:flagellar basal-body rod protein FlgB